MAEVMSLMTDLIDFGRVTNLPPAMALRSFLTPHQNTEKESIINAEEMKFQAPRIRVPSASNSPNDTNSMVENSFILGQPLSTTLFQVLLEPVGHKSDSSFKPPNGRYSN